MARRSPVTIKVRRFSSCSFVTAEPPQPNCTPLISRIRRWPIERRKDALTRLLGRDRGPSDQPAYAPADVVFQHICQPGLEGIVSKKLGSRYECGRLKYT